MYLNTVVQNDYLKWTGRTLKRTESFFGFPLNPLSANPTKWSNTLLPTNCLSVFDHFVGLALEGLKYYPCPPPRFFENLFPPAAKRAGKNYGLLYQN